MDRDIDVMADVLVILTPWSLKKALFWLMTVLTVTPPVPVTAGFTVSAIAVVRVSVPLVPVTVTVAFPVVAVPDAVKLSTLVPVVGFVLNAVLTPVGTPLALSVTLPVNPFVGTTVMVLLAAAPPCTTVTLAGLGDSVKPGVLVFTVRLIVVVWTCAPLVPVTVTVAGGPAVAVADAVKLSTLVPVVGFVLNAVVTPVGTPLALSVTLPVNPPNGVTVIVLDAAGPP